MKKIIIGALFMIFGSFSMASAELGVNVGVSGTMGVFEGSATETEGTEVSQKDEGILAVGWGSLFIEKTLGDRIAIGIDYVPGSISSETDTDEVSDLKAKTAGARATGNQKIQVDFEDLTTLYISVNITDNFYVKAGAMEVDVITNEALHTGSTYGNTSLDGSVYGAGYHKSFDNGMFLRTEALVMEFDGATLTSTTNSDNKVTVNQLDGASAKISIGRSF